MSAKAHSSSFISVKEAFHQLQSTRPDPHLDSNILKLCQGLRKQGLTNYAETLENKFLQYKQANALYDVSGETGEDVVNQAHPDGSHAMENVEGDATIETILERSKKIQQVVNKMPTGKLASKDALNVARILLAQTTQTTDQLKQTVKSNLQAFRTLFRKIKTITDKESTFQMSDSGLDDMVSDPTYIKIKSWIDFTQQHMDIMKPSISGLITNFGIGQMSEHTWGEVNGAFNNCLFYLRNALEAQGEIDDRQRDQLEVEKTPDATTPTTTTTAPAQPAALSPAEQKRQDLINKINSSTKMNDDNKKKAFDWLNAQKSRLADPQTTAQTSTYIDQLEKQLRDQGFIS